jgi:NAD(P)-dependent dehydrogenase (short-subunit alcohol dehydrogenase family)
MDNILSKFKLDSQVAIITGGAGLLGIQHAYAIAEAGGIPVLWDINETAVTKAAESINTVSNIPAMGISVDVTNKDSISNALSKTLKSFKRIDILVNNAAKNPQFSDKTLSNWNRLENFDLDSWDMDLSVGLTGAFLCCQTVGTYLAKLNKGIIINVSSDLSVISPDQRLYRKDGIAEDQQPVKPITYSVIKHGLIGLTKYLATYWAKNNVRVNAISPGGIYNDQPEEFVKRLTDLIPMGRMARVDEYKAAIVFLCSEASSYMTGQNIILDGGRTVL